MGACDHPATSQLGRPLRFGSTLCYPPLRSEALLFLIRDPEGYRMPSGIANSAFGCRLNLLAADSNRVKVATPNGNNMKPILTSRTKASMAAEIVNATSVDTISRRVSREKAYVFFGIRYKCELEPSFKCGKTTAEPIAGTVPATEIKLRSSDKTSAGTAKPQNTWAAASINVVGIHKSLLS
ncbi:hypothetical protein MFFC18_21650 [Mariniblastus fucicola]|uniref:Uncharacterized protein n=1 Tax=Mariniblastus fucicola TaxID=980251 RepID=A0A5B9P9Z4_9BACT|nr:hypothetical protein MFFC18_21650 [Mariniblastus fucicola]